MPLQTACSSCSAKIKVKDELVGKLIKCPKCGDKFKAAPAGAETAVQAATATQPAAKKPPAPVWGDDEEEDKGSPWEEKPSKKGKDEDEQPKKKPKTKPAKDDDEPDEDEQPKKKPKTKPAKDEDDDDEPEEDADFGELLARTLLPESTKLLVKAELGLKERGVWVGQPCPTIMTVRASGKAIAALVFLTVFGVVGVVMASTALGQNWYFAAGPLGFLLFILLFAVPAFILFMDRRAAMHTAYVITSKRCIVFTGRWFLAPSLESFYPDLLQHMHRMGTWFFGDTAGDLVFRSVTVISHGKNGTSATTTYYGFLGIRKLDEAERIIRETLLADDDDDDDDEDEPPRKKKKKKRDDDD